MLSIALHHRSAARWRDLGLVCARILERQPTHLQGLELFAQAALQLGDYEQATNMAVKALAIDPNSDSALEIRCHAVWALGQWSFKANLLVKQATQRGFMPKSLARVAWCLFQEGDVDGAIGYAKKALAQHPELALAHEVLGNSDFMMGAFESALAHYRTWSELAPDSGQARNNQGAAWLKLGDAQAALNCFETALLCDSAQVDWLCHAANAANVLDQKQRALSFLERAYQLLPARGEIALAYAELLMEECNVEQALSIAAQWAEDEHHSDQALWLMARALKRLNRSEDVIKCCEPLLNHPEFSDSAKSLLAALK